MAVVQDSAEAKASFALILSRMESLEAVENQIKNALREQNQGNSDVLEAIVRIRERMGTVRGRSRAIHGGSGAIGEEMAALVDRTEKIHLAMEAIRGRGRDMIGVFSELEALGLANHDQAQGLARLVGRFRLF